MAQIANPEWVFLAQLLLDLVQELATLEIAERIGVDPVELSEALVDALRIVNDAQISLDDWDRIIDRVQERFEAVYRDQEDIHYGVYWTHIRLVLEDFKPDIFIRE